MKIFVSLELPRCFLVHRDQQPSALVDQPQLVGRPQLDVFGRDHDSSYGFVAESIRAEENGPVVAASPERAGYEDFLFLAGCGVDVLAVPADVEDTHALLTPGIPRRHRLCVLHPRRGGWTGGGRAGATAVASAYPRGLESGDI